MKRWARSFACTEVQVAPMSSPEMGSVPQCVTAPNGAVVAYGKSAKKFLRRSPKRAW